MTPCPDQTTLQRLLLESLEPTQRDSVDEHVQTCSVCQAILEKLTSSLPLMLPVLPRTEPSLPNAELVPRIPGYEIQGVLGRGGMGIVYQAHHLALNRIVALKVVLAQLGVDDETRRRFRSEAEAIARLQHPNIVQIFEVGEHDGQPFLSLELCSGGNLARELAGSPLPPTAAAQLTETLARAMHAAHQANVIHRDLKPANVLLCRPAWPTRACDDAGVGHARLQPKITDFGIAKRLDADGQTQTGAVMGTPSYMAPEQAKGSKDVGPAADIYSLGAILYELLTGRPPFKAATTLDTLQQVVSEEPVPPRRLNPRVPADLQTICLKCLHKEPARRYDSAAELADDLGRFGESRPILARPVSLWQRTVKWAQRNPATFALIAVSLVAVLGLLALGTYYNVRLTRERNDAREQRRKAERALALAVQTGGVLDNLGMKFYERNRNDEKEETFRLAVDAMSQNLELLEAMVEEAPDNPDIRAALAASLQNRGDLNAARPRPDDAEKDLRRALAEWQAIVGAHPDRADFATKQALTQVVYSRFLFYVKNTPEEAVAQSEQAIAVLERAVRVTGTPQVTRTKLTEAYVVRAQVHLAKGRLLEALADWENALADPTLRSGVLRFKYEWNRTYTIARLGHHIAAAKAAEKLRRAPEFHQDYLRDLADIYALCARAAADAQDMPSASRRAEVEQHASRAVKVLGEAVAAGQLKGRADADALAKNPDLSALVGRPEFEAILAKLRGR